MFKTAAALLLTVFVSLFAVACGDDDSSDTSTQGDAATMQSEGTESEAAMKDEQEAVGDDAMKPETGSDDAMKPESEDSMEPETGGAMKPDPEDAMKAEDEE